MPLSPWRLRWWHLAWIQRTEDATKLPLKSITWVSVFIRDALKLSHQDDTQLFLYDLFLSFILLVYIFKAVDIVKSIQIPEPQEVFLD